MIAVTDTLARPLVAVLIPNFEAGGAERSMIRLAGGLVAMGYRVDLLVLSERGPYRDELDERVRIVSLRAPRAWIGLAVLLQYLRREQPVAMLSALFHMNFIATIARKLACVRTRIVLSEHNTQELVSQSVGSLRWRLYCFLLRHTYPMADAVVAVSKGIADDLVQAVPQLASKTHVIGNPVVTREMMAMAKEPLEHSWANADDFPLVLAVGRLIKAKGFDVLLSAFSLVLKKKSARLVILGAGPEYSHLATQVAALGLQGKVELLGFTKNPYSWMRRARVFVLPSRLEGLPGVLIEAMACGCRVVSTNCRYGPAEILSQGQWGSLVPVDDAQALAVAIVDALDSSIAPAVQIRAEDYNLENATKAYCELLRLPPISSRDHDAAV